MKRMNTLAALTLSGVVALSPVLALADTSVDVNANVQTNVHHDSAGFNYDSSVKASTTENHDQNLNGDHKIQKEADKAANKMQKGENRGSAALDARIGTLQRLETHINDMARLTADQKTAIAAQISAQIAALTELKAKITTDVSTSTLIADLKTIRPDYRTYLLTLPRTAIIAASDRVMTIAGQMDAIGAKLQARITAAQAAGVNVSSAQSAYADYQSKVADAKVQAQAANSLVINLSPDAGNATVLAANKAALKAARAKLEAARADIAAARKDMKTIMQAVKGKGEHAEVKGTASTTVESH